MCKSVASGGEGVPPLAVEKHQRKGGESADALFKELLVCGQPPGNCVILQIIMQVTCQLCTLNDFNHLECEVCNPVPNKVRKVFRT